MTLPSTSYLLVEDIVVTKELSNMSETTDADYDHLEDVDDGCGCAEIWETMSERRGVESGGRAADD